MPLHYFLSDTEMANTVMSEEAYGFHFEWIAAGSGIGEEICGVDKDCIVVPTSPELPKLEAQDNVEDYVEIQVTEEEVVTDQWNSHHTGSEEEGLGFRVDMSQEEDVIVPLSVEQDEYSRLHPYPCDFCSRRFSKKSALTTHMVSHQIARPHGCNMCGAQYHRKHDLVEHMKSHAYAPIKEEPEDEYEELPPLPQVKSKQRTRRKKKNLKKYEYDVGITKGKKMKTDPFEDLKFDIGIPQIEPPKFPIIDPSRPYVCQHCGVGFAREKALTSHTMIHVGDSAFECEACGEMFQSEEYLEQHNSQRHGHLPRKREDGYGSFLCNECGMSFQWYNQLKKHRKTHVIKTHEEIAEEDEGHLCTLCNVVFSNLDEFLCHKQDHDPDIGVHSCYVCGEVYESTGDLRDHMKNKHKSSHMCHLCEKMFKDGKALSKHHASHIEARSFPCSVCARRFHTKAKLKKHMTSHDENKSTSAMACRECGEEFHDGQSLLSHKQNVHGINISRMFPCLQCGKAFNSRSSHQIHLRIHTGERPYGCKYCWKAFGDGGTLRKHERIHTGEKPYVCPVCSKAFNQRVVLREHIRAHHSGSESRLTNNSYECMVCGTLMNTSSELCAHLVLHSDENTAKHRTPKGNRKYVRKKRYNTSGFDEDSASAGEEEQRKLLEVTPPPPPQIIKYSEELESVIKIEPELMSPSNIDTKGRARIVRSGRKGVPRGQNKRYMRGKTKAARLMSNTSYASKYVVSHPDNSDPLANTGPEMSVPLMNGSAPRSRPRTKNVSYHNTKAELRYELATFPLDKPTRKRATAKREPPPDSVDNQYVNGIELFEETGGEQIETCIVDDIDVELKLEVKTSESEECFIGADDIAIKTELVSCDMCSEVFTSRSDLLKHIQIHI